jgi:hypothetical protein
MEKCRACGADLPEGVTRCPRCGIANEENRAEPQTAERPGMFAPRSDLNGIGGWLILVAVGLAISPLVSLHGLYRDFRLLFGHTNWAVESYHGLALLILFEAITNTIFFLSLAGLNYLFYLKKKSFLGWMIAFLCVQPLIILVDHLAAMRYFPTVSLVHPVRALISAAIWIPYLLRSLRVKETFTH